MNLRTQDEVVEEEETPSNLAELYRKYNEERKRKV
jgi:hypothetical protein